MGFGLKMNGCLRFKVQPRDKSPFTAVRHCRVLWAWILMYWNGQTYCSRSSAYLFSFSFFFYRRLSLSLSLSLSLLGQKLLEVKTGGPSFPINFSKVITKLPKFSGGQYNEMHASLVKFLLCSILRPEISSDVFAHASAFVSFFKSGTLN